MEHVRLSCTLCLPGPAVELPLAFAAAMVFHAIVHHGVTEFEVDRVRRSGAMRERDRYTPMRARWILPGGRPWLTEWQSSGDGRPLPTIMENRRVSEHRARHG